MELLQIKNLSFTYPDSEKKALDGISFSVKQGEFVLLSGVSGCGKTTLLRSLKKETAPQGERQGEIAFEGKSVFDFSALESARNIGFVQQDPDRAIVTDKVWHELSFGLENLGLPSDQIRRKTAEIASFFGIQNIFHQETDTLSGGQKQLLNLASVLVMDPKVLLLDEPTANLDPISSSEFYGILRRVHLELGMTILLSEHRLEEAFSMADRVLVLNEGKILLNAAPSELADDAGQIPFDSPFYPSLPTPIRMTRELNDRSSHPLSIREGKAYLEKRYFPLKKTDQKDLRDDYSGKEPVLRFRDVFFRYEKNAPDLLKGFDFSLFEKETFCLLGGNGSGKSTLLKLASGLLLPYHGAIFVDKKRAKRTQKGTLPVGYLPQNVRDLFLKSTVFEDLDFLLSARGVPKDERDRKIKSVCADFHIDSFLSRHPNDLSGGERERCAIAKIFLTDPKILLLDEPTQGMDASFKIEFAHLLDRLKERGVAVLMVTHDIEFAALFADRCGFLFDGQIVSQERTKPFFASNRFYTTASHRMARDVFPEAVTLPDLLSFAEKAERR